MMEGGDPPFSHADEKFHKYFSFVSANERVLEAQKCVMYKEFEEKGTLFLTSIRFAFYSDSGHKEHLFLENVKEVEYTEYFLGYKVIIHSDTPEKYVFSMFKARKVETFVSLFQTLVDVRKKMKLALVSPSDKETEGFDDTSSDTISDSTEGDDKPNNAALVGYRNRFLDQGGDDASDSLNNGWDGKHESFKQIFRDLADSETAVSRYRCTLLNKDNGGGVLYITQHFALFSYGKPIKIPLEEISRIEKEQFFMVIDGITLTVNGSKSYSFVNLLSPDDTVKAIEAAITRLRTGEGEKGAFPESTPQLNIDLSKIPVCESRDDFSRVETDYGTAFSDYSCFSKSLISPIDFPTGKTLVDVFAVAFADGATILVKYHSDREDTEQKIENWRPTRDGVGFRGQRLFTCMTPVKVFFGKRYPYTEYQRYAFLNVNGSPTLMVQFSSQISGVMTGDAFRAEALIVCTQRGSGNETCVQMEAFGYVQFLKNVWVKAKITHNTLDIELPDGYKKIGEMMAERLQSTSLSANTQKSCAMELNQSPSIPQYVEHPFVPYVMSSVPECPPIVVLSLLLDLLVVLCCLVTLSKEVLRLCKFLPGEMTNGTISETLPTLSTTLNSVVLFFAVQYGLALLMLL